MVSLERTVVKLSLEAPVKEEVCKKKNRQLVEYQSAWVAVLLGHMVQQTLDLELLLFPLPFLGAPFKERRVSPLVAVSWEGRRRCLERM